MCPKRRRARPRAQRPVEAVHSALRRRRQAAPRVGDRVQLGVQPGRTASADSRRGDSGMSSGVPCTLGAQPGAVGQAQGGSDRVPGPGLDRHQPPPGRSRRPASSERGHERALVGEVVQHQPVEHHVVARRRPRRRARRRGRPTRRRGRPASTIRSIQTCSSSTPVMCQCGLGEQVPPRVPAAAHREHAAAARPSRAVEQLASRARGSGRSGAPAWPRGHAGRGGCPRRRARSPAVSAFSTAP